MRQPNRFEKRTFAPYRLKACQLEDLRALVAACGGLAGESAASMQKIIN